MIVTGYQTLEDQENADYIEQYGPFVCKRPDAWLGDGYYFWDSNIDWAHDWGDYYSQNGYVICSSQIRLDETVFDLFGNVKHQQLFERAYIALRERTRSEVTVPQVINAMKMLKAFPFHAIRAFDEPRTVSTIRYNHKRPEQLIIGQRVQICLVNKNNLLSQTFRIVFPEKYVI
ncbi:hypothetical protein ACAW74_04105 [Fibrella sp. WM1]|uniref:hypothetical protein n=1 Tax=Fibrella musci TaxID=3242485 RepID=UPI003522FF3E